MPRLPTIRVIGSQAISTNRPGSRDTCEGSGMIAVIALLFPLDYGSGPTTRSPHTHRGQAATTRSYQVRVAPVSSLVPGWRHLGSLSTVRPVIWRRLRITDPYNPTAVVDTLPPGGSSINGMNL